MARVYSSTSVATTLASTITDIATSMTVTAGGGAPLIQGSGFVNGDIFTIAIDPDTQNEEICYVTANSGDTFTITRGEAGSSQITHPSGATVRHVLTSDDLDYFRNGVITADAAIPASTLTTKGDLLSRTTATLQRVPIGSNGQVLTADSAQTAGIKWSTVNNDITISTVTGTTYTIASTDVNKLVQLNNAAAIAVTVPASVFTAGQQVNIQQTGAGQVTVQGDGTTTLTSTGASGPAPKTSSQYSAATIICTSSNNFTVIGDLS